MTRRGSGPFARFVFGHILHTSVESLILWLLMIEMLDYGYVEVRNKTTNVCDEKHLTAAS